MRRGVGGSRSGVGYRVSPVGEFEEGRAMGRGALPRLAAMLVLLGALALAACGDDTAATGSSQPAAAGGGGGSNDGGLVSLGQAQQAAQQWWSDHEQALARRDATALARLDADPGALVTIQNLRVALATQRGLIAQPRTPSAVRVHVPAGQQSWPVPILAVFDLPGSGKSGGGHVAALLMARGGGAPLVALESAALDAPEPQFDVDTAGYVRLIAAADQPAALGRTSADISSTYGTYMSGLAHGSTPASTAPFADGQFTSGLAQKDAAFIAKAAAHQSGSVGSVQLGYIDLNFPTPVFALKGGGGLTMAAVQRDETLLPAQGQAFLQDQSRNNWGVELAPGQYQQITMHSIVILAVRMPAAGAPMQVMGSGGGVYSEG